jgi:RNA polymerase sigma-70 factor (ECF subfamily)
LEPQLRELRLRLLRQARFAVGDEGLAEDLVQDTLIAVVQQADSHRGDSSLTTWATAILKNKVADWYRSPARRRFEPLAEAHSEGTGDHGLFDGQGQYLEAVPAWQQPENQVERRQMVTVLENCVNCLPARSGRVFMMREWLGFETAEVCEQLGLTAENCRTMLHRARTALRMCMQRRWIETEGHA